VEEQVMSSEVSQLPGNNFQVLFSMISGHVLVPDERYTGTEDFQL